MDRDKAVPLEVGNVPRWGQTTEKGRVAVATFAGRVGGNQDFITNPDDSDEKQPDAVSCVDISA